MLITKSRRGIFVGRMLHRGRKVEFVSVAKAILFFLFFWVLVDWSVRGCLSVGVFLDDAACLRVLSLAD